METTLTRIAEAIGVQRGEDGGCACAVCGDSPFELAGQLKALGTFNDFDVLAGAPVDAVCAGCKRILGGRPGHGDNPIPLRARSFELSPDGDFRFLTRAELWDVIKDQPLNGQIVSWATSGKRHHALHAGVSDNETWRIGSDSQTIVVKRNAMLELCVNVKTLLYMGVSKGAILTGRYPPHVATLIAGEYSLTGVQSYRGSPILDLVVHAAIKPEEKAVKQVKELMKMTPAPELEPADEQAIQLLAALATASSRRREDGKRFWDDFYLNRVRRFARLPLNDFVSRVMGEINVAAVNFDVAAFNGVEDPDAVMRAIRERPVLLHALAFDRVRAKRGGGKLTTS